MDNILVIIVVALIVGLAVLYIHKQKKHGVKCIGCPNGCSCQKNCGDFKSDASSTRPLTDVSSLKHQS